MTDGSFHVVRAFLLARPLQASKLLVGFGTIILSVLSFLGAFGSSGGLTAFITMPFIGVLLGAVVVLESLVTMAKWLLEHRDSFEGSWPAPAYLGVRLLETGAGLASAGLVIWLLGRFSGEPMPPPAAIGLAMYMTGAALIVLIGVVIRGVVEFTRFRTRSMP